MKAVIDTAVLVSAALAVAADTVAHSRLIAQRAFNGDSFELVTSQPMLLELSDVLSRPRLGLSARDPGDDKVLETTLNSNADFLVARDRDLHDARARYSIEKVGIGIRSRPIRVVGVSAFLEALDAPDFSALIAAALIEV
jgi:predicted nucleic acid-binding protein